MGEGMGLIFDRKLRQNLGCLYKKGYLAGLFDGFWLMNTIWIVLPILTVLMFDLGLILEIKDFKLFLKRPRPVWAGLAGQLLLLPLLAFVLARAFDLEPYFFLGVMLIACSPGGSSSNVFSMIAKADVALSVSLTALSSLLTFLTLPLIMSFVTRYVGGAQVSVQLPVGKLIVQNLVLTLLPVALGILLRARRREVAERIHKVLSKCAFPALILLATVFFAAHYETILAQIGKLGLCLGLLILLAMGGGLLLSRGLRLTGKEERTLVIEVGMQNAAQAIAIACSPFVFNKPTIAVPAIVYALLMNVILLSYIAIKAKRAAA